LKRYLVRNYYLILRHKVSIDLDIFLKVNLKGYSMQKLKTRVTWGFNPVTRVVKSKKVYNRKKNKQTLLREHN